MAKRKIFTESFPDSKDAPERKVLRTHVEFYYGIWEIVCGMTDQSFRLDRAEELLVTGRQAALKLLKHAFQQRGYQLQELDPHDAVGQSDFVIDGKPKTKKVFIGLLTTHVQQLFPELAGK